MDRYQEKYVMSKEKIKEVSEEEKALDSIKNIIEMDWGKDNDSQGKASQLFKALSFNNSKIANEFMDEINKFTSSLKNKYLK